MTTFRNDQRITLMEFDGQETMTPMQARVIADLGDSLLVRITTAEGEQYNQYIEKESAEPTKIPVGVAIETRVEEEQVLERRHKRKRRR